MKHATTSAVVIHAWWAHAPLANPAIATGDVSRLTVLDVDGDKGGYDSLAALERQHAPIPHTIRVNTASGEHLYFKYPGTHLKNSTGTLGPGLDMRCCGGYVVTNGATHRSGTSYTWKDGHRPGQAPIANVPDWLHERLQPKQPTHEPRTTRGYGAAALASEERQLLQAPQGQRNQRLNLAAFRLARFITSGVLTHADVEHVLHDAANRLGLPDREASATIASGLRAGTQQPR